LLHKEYKNNPLEKALSQALPFLSSFLDLSEVCLLALIEKDGQILYINTALAKCLKVDCKTMVGQNLLNYLTEPDGELLALHLTEQKLPPEGKLLLNLVDIDQVPHSFHFRIATPDDKFLLIGEPPQNDNQELQEELIQLNNQLSVLSRENIRKGRELTKTLCNLKSTQAMLVHQEKMASLGQMTAGIAHEINNPLAFVLSNEQVLKRDFNDLLAFVNTLGDALPELATLAPRIHADIVAKSEEFGLEYLAEAVPRKIVANIEGLERVKEIILDLRSFSRLDEAERKACDLAEGIEATLLFLGPLFKKHGVTVETDFAALPPLLCSPGPLNQAINNITANAIQASQPGQTVKVSTRMQEGWYCIEVKDQGSGIAAEHLSKIFDPFFTTKAVGSGTGLGLSITHQVVAAHDGKIEIDSKPGTGTTVRILLP